jgi:predicted DNA-binding protein (MmcQ/YjbR family)
MTDKEGGFMQVSMEMKAHIEKADNGWIVVIYDKRGKDEYLKRFIARTWEEVKDILKKEVK